jgi:hypothetical protein
MTTFLIEYHAAGKCFTTEYATVEAETSQLAMQKAIMGLPELKQLSVVGTITHKITEF